MLISLSVRLLDGATRNCLHEYTISPSARGYPLVSAETCFFFSPMRTSTQFVCNAEMLGVLLCIHVGIILTPMQLAFYFETLNPHS